MIVRLVLKLNVLSKIENISTSWEDNKKKRENDKW